MYVLVAARHGSWDGTPQLCTMTQGDQHWNVAHVRKLGHGRLPAQSTQTSRQLLSYCMRGVVGNMFKYK